MAPRDLLTALLVILLWGINFVPTKVALEDFSPLQLGALRFLLVGVSLVLWIPRPQVPLRWLLLFALSQGVGQFGLLFYALQAGMTAAMASVLMQTQIFFTALLGVSLLGESISRALMLGMAVAGAGLLFFAADVAAGEQFPLDAALGFLLTLCAAAMWSVSNIVVKKIHGMNPGCPPALLLVWGSLVSGLVFAALSLLTEDYSGGWRWLADVGPRSWLSVLYAGWLAGGLAFWLWTVLLTRYPASQVAPFSLGVPVVGMFAGIVVLGEEVSRLQWIGSALVMAALVIVVASSRLTLLRLRRRYKAD
ncbi:EamA family transporter [Haliea sp. E17]|uniref:EamA family transporter n=1 Tax=Haliea sp. E17 TaxID=3401576 RepID=UPI003AAC0098